MVFSHPSRLIHPQISVGWAPPVPQLFPTSVIAFGLPALGVFQTPAIWLRGCSGQHTLYGPIAVLGHGFWALASRYHQSSFIIPHIPTGLMVSLEWWLFPTSTAAGMTVPFTCLTKMSTLTLDLSDILNIKLFSFYPPPPHLCTFSLACSSWRATGRELWPGIRHFSVDLLIHLAACIAAEFLAFVEYQSRHFRLEMSKVNLGLCRASDLTSVTLWDTPGLACGYQHPANPLPAYINSLQTFQARDLVNHPRINELI